MHGGAPHDENIPPRFREGHRRVLSKKPATLRLVRSQGRECLLGHFIRKVLEKCLFVTLLVTLDRRPYAMVVRQREAPGSSEGMRTIVGSTTGESGVGTVSRFACAAGATLILARSRNR
jgi:hypothetical protein